MSSAVPLSVAAPAVIAGLSYLNAKTSFWYDWLLVRSVIPTGLATQLREMRGRLNAFYLLEDRAKNSSTSSVTFLKFEGRSYTYAQTYDRVLRYGAWLRKNYGVKPKDIVAMNFENSDTFIFLWFGLWAIGAKPAFINFNLTGSVLTHCVKAATTSLLLVDPNVVDKVSEDVRRDLDSVRIVVLTPELERDILATEPVRYPDEDRYEDRGQNMAALIYTSGTTGLPKAAIMSWAKTILGAGVVSRWLGWRPGDVFYTAMPLYHSSAAVMGVLNTIECGKTIAIGRKFSATKFWDEVREHDATIIQYVGEMCRYLLGAPPRIDPVTGKNIDKANKVHTAFGNGLRPDIWAAFKDRFGIDAIGEFYAATEAPLAMFNLSKNDHALGAMGRNGWLYDLVMSFRMAVIEVDTETNEPIRDPKTGRCRKVGAGEPGELLHRLPAGDTSERFQGYYNNAKATSSKILRDVFSKGDAWFRTGDTVIWDNEGRVFFSDRIGDTFRWKSENVSTMEVSHVMGLHPAIHEANVYGVELPHHDGRAGCAAVVLNGQPDEITMRSIAGHVTKALPPYARPVFLRILPEMGEATTATLKHQKHSLRTEGVDPTKVDPATVWWLKGGEYVPFTESDWKVISDGKARL
ncbi:related to FAT1 - very long-chain fatty acyl-CoA synthetase [Cephalotrichum gorgonifer]|uniref:Very long-chain fatty acid transport protein n=1 Tax=Cephalotrichum gorgonifer TaxID=2041049 RepID=A0AAE8N7E8_9PEZI|nr:related to FAT1 - very long-chain fatty acyl-CoA synthetase [Cephalotrichum gorgonifer]